MNAVLVFVTQFVYILLLGLQTSNVAHGHYGQAMAVSLMLGIGGLYLTSMIAVSAVQTGDWTVRVAYVAAGPPAIALAIWMHRGRRK